MKVLGRILVTLGVVFVGLVVLAGVLFWQQAEFGKDYEPFVRAFMADYAGAWDIVEVRDRVTNEFLLQAQSPTGVQVAAFCRRMGKLREISDLTVERFHAGTGGRTGTFSFKAEFQHAPAVVTLQLHVADGEPRVVALNVQPLAEPPLVPSEADI
jgi:hypothetical protein